MRRFSALLLIPLLTACADRTPSAPKAFESVSGVIQSLDDAPVVTFDGHRLNAVAPKFEANTDFEDASVLALSNGGTAPFPSQTLVAGPPALRISIGDPGETVLVSENAFATLPGAVQNPSAGGGFEALSGVANLSVRSGTTLTLRFLGPDGTTPVLVHGFGAVFSDVEVDGRSGLRYFNASGDLIRDQRVPAAPSGADQFVGTVFSAPIIGSVVLDLGDNTSFGTSAENPATGDDHVVVDSFRFTLSDLGLSPP